MPLKQIQTLATNKRTAVNQRTKSALAHLYPAIVDNDKGKLGHLKDADAAGI